MQKHTSTATDTKDSAKIATDADSARQLTQLNDHLLRDIGLSRNEVELMSGDVFRMLR